jgi:hypothetical protein
MGALVNTLTQFCWMTQQVAAPSERALLLVELPAVTRLELQARSAAQGWTDQMTDQGMSCCCPFALLAAP